MTRRRFSATPGEKPGRVVRAKLRLDGPGAVPVVMKRVKGVGMRAAGIASVAGIRRVGASAHDSAGAVKPA